MKLPKMEVAYHTGKPRGLGALPSSIDRRSIRRRNVKGGFLLFACPRGQWQPKKQRCKVGMRLVEKKTSKRRRR